MAKSHSPAPYSCTWQSCWKFLPFSQNSLKISKGRWLYLTPLYTNAMQVVLYHKQFCFYFYTLLFHLLFKVKFNIDPFCSGRTPGALVKTIKYSKFQIILFISVCNFTFYLTLPYILPYLTLRLTLHYLTSYLTLPYVLPYFTLPYHTLCLTLLYYTLL